MICLGFSGRVSQGLSILHQCRLLTRPLSAFTFVVYNKDDKFYQMLFFNAVTKNCSSSIIILRTRVIDEDQGCWWTSPQRGRLVLSLPFSHLFTCLHSPFFVCFRLIDQRVEKPWSLLSLLPPADAYHRKHIACWGATRHLSLLPWKHRCQEGYFKSSQHFITVVHSFFSRTQPIIRRHHSSSV